MAVGSPSGACLLALVSVLLVVPVAPQPLFEAVHASADEAGHSSYEFVGLDEFHEVHEQDHHEGHAESHSEHAASRHTDHHGHGGHHHVVKSVMGTTTAIMLLSFVAFIMALFYLVNWHDEDIRQYTWVITSVTISIFLAVLSFSAISEAVEVFFPDSLITDLIIFFVIWVLTQAFLLVFKGSGNEHKPLAGDGVESQPLQPSADPDGRVGSPQSAGSQVWQGPPPNVPLKAFGTLLAHVTGFAAIKCFVHMQLTTHLYFSSSWWSTLLVIPIFIAVAWVLITVSAMARKKIITSFGDMKEDEGEEQWREQCRETEDDATCLCLSSLAGVVIRYAITGRIPSAHGTVDGRSFLEVAMLFFAGMVFLALVVVFTYILNKMGAAEEEEDTNNVHVHKVFDKERFLNCLQVWSGLAMSWCFFFSTQWGFFVLLQSRESLKGVAGKLLQAVLVSFCCTLVIFVLDCIGDGSPSMKKALKGLITSLGLLVGISWEGAFKTGVDEIAVNWHDPIYQLVVKTLLAFGLVAVVLPAWRLYILPRSDPEIMTRVYQGRLPPLSSLCCSWDPAKDQHQSKSERFRKKTRGATLRAAAVQIAELRKVSKERAVETQGSA